VSKSRTLFEEGKRFLLAKDYKEAIKAFTQSIKINQGNRDSKYYRAICFLDSENPKKCI
jgi:tetratricopeptide (TPR) repeat protein